MIQEALTMFGLDLVEAMKIGIILTIGLYIFFAQLQKYTRSRGVADATVGLYIQIGLSASWVLFAIAFVALAFFPDTVRPYFGLM